MKNSVFHFVCYLRSLPLGVPLYTFGARSKIFAPNPFATAASIFWNLFRFLTTRPTVVGLRLEERKNLLKICSSKELWVYKKRKRLWLLPFFIMDEKLRFSFRLLSSLAFSRHAVLHFVFLNLKTKVYKKSQSGNALTLFVFKIPSALRKILRWKPGVFQPWKCWRPYRSQWT